MYAAQKHDAVYRHFAYLRDDDKSEEYINDHPELLNEHATGWMLLHCLELEMEGKSREMHKVARQNDMLEYITRSCREVKVPHAHFCVLLGSFLFFSVLFCSVLFVSFVLYCLF